MKKKDESLNIADITGVFQRVLKIESLEGGKNINYLLGVSFEKDPEIRAAAANGLSKQKDARAVDRLVEMSRDKSPRVRASVANILGQLENPKIIDVLIQLLDDKHTKVRIAAAIALGGSANVDVDKYLIRRLTDNNHGVVIACIRGLVNLKSKKSIISLIPLLASPNKRIYQAAFIALNELTAPLKPVNFLSQLFAQNEYLEKANKLSNDLKFN